MTWGFEQDVAAAVFPDLELSDGDEGEHSDDGMQTLMFDGGHESAPPRMTPSPEPQDDDGGKSRPEGPMVDGKHGADALSYSAECRW